MRYEMRESVMFLGIAFFVVVFSVLIAWVNVMEFNKCLRLHDRWTCNALMRR